MATNQEMTHARHAGRNDPFKTINEQVCNDECILLEHHFYYFLFHFEFNKLFSFPFRFVCPVMTTTRKTETLATTKLPATTPRHTRKQPSEQAPTGARPHTSNPSHSLSTVQNNKGVTGTKDHGASRPTGISRVITGMKEFFVVFKTSWGCVQLEFYANFVWLNGPVSYSEKNGNRTIFCYIL